MIKPEDIPQSLMDATFKHTESYTEAGQRRDIAAILNAAIEAGVVSPPVFCVRQNGELYRYDTGAIKVFSGKPWAHDTEHWKGQNE